MHVEPSWQHARWHRSALWTSSPYFVSKLFNRGGLADDGHGKHVFCGLVDFRLQFRCHLQQVGAFTRNLLLARVVSIRGKRCLLRARRGSRRAGSILARRGDWGGRGLRMALHIAMEQAGAGGNGKRGAARQQTKAPSTASKPDLGPVWSSVTRAWRRPQHGTKMCRRKGVWVSGHSCAQSSLEG